MVVTCSRNVIKEWPTVNSKKGGAELLHFRGDGIPTLIHLNTSLLPGNLSYFMYNQGMFTTNRLLHRSTIHKVCVQYLSVVVTAAQMVPMATILLVQCYKKHCDC